MDTDLKANQQINFTGHLDRAGNTTVFLKGNYFVFSQEAVRVL